MFGSSDILESLTQLHYHAVGAVLYDHGYDLAPGEPIYPDQIVQAIEEIGIDVAADLSSAVASDGGNVSTTSIIEAVERYAGSDPVFSGLAVDWQDLGWLVATILLIALLAKG